MRGLRLQEKVEINHIELSGSRIVPTFSLQKCLNYDIFAIEKGCSAIINKSRTLMHT